MGHFRLIPDINDIYTAHITFEDGSEKTYPLPKDKTNSNKMYDRKPQYLWLMATKIKENYLPLNASYLSPFDKQPKHPFSKRLH